MFYGEYLTAPGSPSELPQQNGDSDLSLPEFGPNLLTATLRWLFIA